MFRRFRAASAVSLLLSLTLIWSVAVATAAPRSNVIVVFEPSVASPRAVARELAQAHGFSAKYVYRHALKGFSAAVPAGRLAALERDPRVAYVETDQIVRTAQDVPTGVQRIFADTNAEIDIDGLDDYRVDVDVAIIDTGIDLDHPDLYVVDSTNCSGGSPFRSSCGTGGDDDHGHGTHVAGTVAALDNGIGVVGVAPGARLHAVKVLSSSGSGYMSWIVAGIDWVTARAGVIEVANMSLGCECSSDAMDDAIAKSVQAGVAYAVAAGNSDKDASTFSPANHPDVLTVSALADFDGAAGELGAPTCRTDQDDTLADFSNWGSQVEIAAPGVCIYSTVPGGNYDTYSGTSMASPHAAGGLALLASNSDPTNQTQVTDLYKTLVSNGNTNWTDDSGDGVQERLLDVSNTTVFNPALVAGSGDGGGGGGNTAPVANDDAYTATAGETLTVSAPGVLGNDTDADNNSLTAVLEAGPANGSLTFSGDGSFSYTPNSGTTSDSFTYRASDGTALSNLATVAITVESSSAGGITLSVTAYKVKGVQHADLTWSGATSGSVKIYRDSTEIATVELNEGTYTDNIGTKGGGSYTYKVCEANDPNTCSNEATANY